MHIDKSHRPWLVASLAILAAATGVYVPYALTSRPGGGTVPGLIYGVIGYAMMLFAALLGARKKVPVWRLGRAQTWMRGHIWMGLLTLPMILFHSGFTVRGPLTTLLMVLLVIVFLSGVTGAAIQHFVPGTMRTLVPLETIYEEIPHVREQLRGEADNLVRVLFSQPDVVTEAAMVAVAAGGSREPDRTEADETIELETEDREYAATVYRTMIAPFLMNPEGADSVLADANRAVTFFEALRRKLPATTHGVIADLESICEEERQLTRQRQIYVWLHGWLLVHVPVSIALIVLGGVHAIVALRY
jgi:hypothetical protein